jgi:hypothetical protein
MKKADVHIIADVKRVEVVCDFVLCVDLLAATVQHYNYQRLQTYTVKRENNTK